MKVCGFTIIRNAVKFDYPVVESITSVLPLCDKFIVSIGNCTDGTLGLIQSIPSDKIQIIHSVWDDDLREGGKVLAVETNKAFDAIPDEYTWAIYIQSDELIHEKYFETIKSAMKKYANHSKVEGLLFKYRHFYGSYDYVGDSRKWYRKEIRVIKNNKQIRSYKDAQGFRKNNQKLRVKPIEAYIYHYGWVKHPKYQQAKQEHFHKMWHDDEWVKKNIKITDEFDYTAIDILKRFEETHPNVMQERVNKINWKFSFDPTQIKLPLKLKILHWIEKKIGWKVGEYKNYKIT
ncbi:MAG: glycosyltransferase family 2 protein [Flavobacteriales bacterium]|nr:glycosyltransferase family 2 protein [Flavobacteriales bacterium]